MSFSFADNQARPCVRTNAVQTMLSACTLSEFVVASAQEAAARIIQSHETIALTRDEQNQVTVTFVAVAPSVTQVVLVVKLGQDVKLGHEVDA